MTSLFCILVVIITTLSDGIQVQLTMAADALAMNSTFDDIKAHLKYDMAGEEVNNDVRGAVRGKNSDLDKFKQLPSLSLAESKEICANPPMEGEEKYCAFSLDPFIDMLVKNLGDRMELAAVKVNRTDNFTVTKTKLIPATKYIICHKLRSSAFYCHSIKKTDIYSVNVVADDDKSIGKVIAACHRDTSARNKKHVAFQLLEAKPGDPICHFVPKDALAFAAADTTSWFAGK